MGEQQAQEMALIAWARFFYADRFAKQESKDVFCAVVAAHIASAIEAARAEEREACARRCEELRDAAQEAADKNSSVVGMKKYGNTVASAAATCADAIRARGGK